ncbi:cytochrome c oxidase assembly factor CtaG [Peribacillus saganii]|uniref:Cytochrome c oxidase assembly factor CtaG n=1 Tax=Peribacillus saganii TaxID=2303992 RepID=A0A372LSF2_9BACI|nr:cytochrome c oxidase assembly factor CtaG [Peribacillus saganii]RFU71141.1 cytochrome c oxidase assembly factor CtaG [Peribacillus saganii]
MSLDIFGFRAMWSPYFFISLLVISAIFFLAATKYRIKFKDSEPITTKQTVLFIVSVVLLYAVKGSPLDLLGHIMFSAHMTQMAVLYLAIPPLLILAIPKWMWRSFLNIKVIGRVFSFCTIPLISLIVFNGLFSFYHIPLIFDFIKTDMLLHAIYTSILFITVIFMWWPLVNQLPEQETLSGVKKVGYIFGNGILLTPACALIIFADAPMYSTFSDPNAWAQAMELCVPSSALSSLNLSGPEMFNGLPLLEDQQLGGILMKVIQEIVYGTVLGYIFFAWFRKENAEADKMDEALVKFQTVE